MNAKRKGRDLALVPRPSDREISEDGRSVRHEQGEMVAGGCWETRSVESSQRKGLLRESTSGLRVAGGQSRGRA